MRFSSQEASECMVLHPRRRGVTESQGGQTWATYLCMFLGSFPGSIRTWITLFLSREASLPLKEFGTAKCRCEEGGGAALLSLVVDTQ